MEKMTVTETVLTDTGEGIFRLFPTCPSTGQITRRSEGKTFTIPNGQAVWWRCSACGGWHTTLLETEQ